MVSGDNGNELQLYVPPLSWRAAQLERKALAFKDAAIPIGRDRLRNPVSSYQSNGNYSLWVNPDYGTEGEEQADQGSENVRLDIASRVDESKEFFEQIAKFLDYLAHFSEAPAGGYFTHRSLVEWELALRKKHDLFVWQLDEQGKSTAQLFELENGAEAELAWTADRIKVIMDQVLTVNEHVEQLKDILQEFSSSRRAKHFGDLKEGLVQRLQIETREHIAQIEQELQSIFHFFLGPMLSSQ